MRFIQFLNEVRENLKDWNLYIRRNKELASAVEVLKKIEKSGYKAYIVGGCVRDLILGVESKDYDLCTNMPINELSKIFNIYPIGSSDKFGIVVIKEKGYDFEIAQFRKESYVKPKTVRKIMK